jgi:hypothetical protein
MLKTYLSSSIKDYAKKHDDVHFKGFSKRIRVQVFDGVPVTIFDPARVKKL